MAPNAILNHMLRAAILNPVLHYCGWTAKLRDLEHATRRRRRRITTIESTRSGCTSRSTAGRSTGNTNIMRPVVQIIQPQIAVATVAKLFSFLSVALASTGFFLATSVSHPTPSSSFSLASSSSGSLAIMSRNIILGVAAHVLRGRVLALHRFGLAIGAEAVSHDANGPWWPRMKSLYWAFLTVPIYSLFLSMRNQVPGWNKEMILKKVTAEFCVGSTLKHPNIIATVDIVSDPAARPQARAQAQARRDHARRLGPRPAAGRARACSQHELAAPRRPSDYTDRDSGSTSITDPPSRITTHSGGSAGALADELGSPRCLQIQNAQPVFKNTVTLPVMGLLTTDSPTEAEMDRNSTELLPLSPREPYTDLTFPSTPSSHTDDLPTASGIVPSPPRTRVATFNVFHTVHVKQAAD
ncbi:hypothetical protein B0H14DRAFT_3860074 [Mycena olivaceomarginata]|nr:hypothetical protein B0H14DRAFT_3860074 [Mycena olivaceomarginata]